MQQRPHRRLLDRLDELVRILALGGEGLHEQGRRRQAEQQRGEPRTDACERDHSHDDARRGAGQGERLGDRLERSATIEKRLLRFDRFRKKVVRPLVGTAYWEDDPDFDLRYHLQQTVLPPPGDQAALQDVASLLASTQLDPTRPLWQFHLVKE